MTRRERIRIAAKVGCDPRTVDKWDEDADSVSPVVAYALEAAARELGVADSPDEQPTAN
jgi:hypothetical protein